MHLEIPNRFAGPPEMGHGGYVAGLLASRTEGAVQVTLRRPIPLDVDLELVSLDGGHLELRRGGEVLVESQPAALELDVPPAPSVDTARAAEASSPSLDGPTGVHPICFGCGRLRDPEDALRVFAGPVEVDGGRQVAGIWRPDPFAERDGTVGRQWVLAALDCPGAFAFLVDGVRAGLLGRITFEQHREVHAGSDLVVSGWRVGEEGRKLFAGTALFDPDGALLASARATWFPMPAASSPSPGQPSCVSPPTPGGAGGAGGPTG